MGSTGPLLAGLERSSASVVRQLNFIEMGVWPVFARWNVAPCSPVLYMLLKKILCGVHSSWIGVLQHDVV